MTPEVIEAVAREIVRTHWERPVEQTDEMFVGCTVMVRDVLAALTAAGYEVRPAASGPVMPEEPSETVTLAVVAVLQSDAAEAASMLRETPAVVAFRIFRAIRAALAKEQGR